MKSAILLTTGFTELHLTNVQKTLLKSKISLDLLSPQKGLVQAWHEKEWGNYYPIATSLKNALASDYDLLVIPGGERHISQLKLDEHAARFLKYFALSQKKIVSLGEGNEMRDALPEEIEILDGKSVHLADWDAEAFSAFLFDLESENQDNLNEIKEAA